MASTVIDQSARARSLHWVHMWSRDMAICFTESTSAMAGLRITRGSHTACTESRWKKFLSLVSPVATLSAYQMRHRPSIVER